MSYFWACTALPALLLLAGPEGDEGSWAAIAQWLAKRAHAAHPELFRAAWRAATWARAKVSAADAAWQRALAPPARARGGSRVPAGAGATRGASAAGGARGVEEVQVGDMDFHFVGLPAGATFSHPALRRDVPLPQLLPACRACASYAWRCNSTSRL